MWRLNNTFSMMGSIFAVIIEMSFGFNEVFILGGFIYFLIFVVGYLRKNIV